MFNFPTLLFLVQTYPHSSVLKPVSNARFSRPLVLSNYLSPTLFHSPTLLFLVQTYSHCSVLKRSILPPSCFKFKPILLYSVLPPSCFQVRPVSRNAQFSRPPVFSSNLSLPFSRPPVLSNYLSHALLNSPTLLFLVQTYPALLNSTTLLLPGQTCVPQCSILPPS